MQASQWVSAHAHFAAGIAMAHTLHCSRGAARFVRSHIPGALSILKGAVPDRARGLGHMAPTYFRREPGIDAPTAIVAPRPLVEWAIRAFTPVFADYETPVTTLTPNKRLSAASRPRVRREGEPGRECVGTARVQATDNGARSPIARLCPPYACAARSSDAAVRLHRERQSRHPS